MLLNSPRHRSRTGLEIARAMCPPQRVWEYSNLQVRISLSLNRCLESNTWTELAKKASRYERSRTPRALMPRRPSPVLPPRLLLSPAFRLDSALSPGAEIAAMSGITTTVPVKMHLYRNIGDLSVYKDLYITERGKAAMTSQI